MVNNYASYTAIAILGIIGIGYLILNGNIRLPIKLPEMGFVRRDGTQFFVDDRPFYINGWNSYWMMSEGVEWLSRSNVRSILDDGAGMGLNLVRTWAFNDAGYHALQRSPGHYDEDVFKALDYVIVEARRRNIRLLLSLTNNLEAFGGKGQYVYWARQANADVGYSNDTFFSDPTIKDYYKSHVKKILTRVNSITGVAYKDEPAIFAWELMNEPRCIIDPSGNTLQTWIEEMSVYVKSLDSKHLLTVGLEGFYNSWSPDSLVANPGHWADFLGSDFIRNHLLSTIDFASIHAYPDIWMPEVSFEEQLKGFSKWVDTHVQDGALRLQKPVLVTEFGLKTKSSTRHRLELLKAMYDAAFDSARNGEACAGAMLWQLLEEGLDEYGDDYAIVPRDEPQVTELVGAHSCRLEKLFHSNFTAAVTHRKNKQVSTCEPLLV
ncbi:mannan endo-1,4-beta-mannosidase 5 [Selaginella moellendorffii]|nr:mannan endo-1,4-beta-mannosidase 5 [Selaginella moellendorffii]|eukprot:XP_002974444.2 mannan endo-1,4-beta-mannosidase 5 [Selaginella moellendorffii]